jgi:single-strand DNA-binding protein
VLIDGELQSHLFKNDDGFSRNIVEIKARRIQFLNKKCGTPEGSAPCVQTAQQHEEEPSSVEDDSFDKFLTTEEAQLLKDHTHSSSQRS